MIPDQFLCAEMCILDPRYCLPDASRLGLGSASRPDVPLCVLEQLLPTVLKHLVVCPKAMMGLFHVGDSDPGQSCARFE